MYQIGDYVITVNGVGIIKEWRINGDEPCVIVMTGGTSDVYGLGEIVPYHKEDNQ